MLSPLSTGSGRREVGTLIGGHIQVIGTHIQGMFDLISLRFGLIGSAIGYSTHTISRSALAFRKASSA